MNCKEFRDIIFTDYIDSELNHEVYNKVKNHIANCDDCAQFEHSLRETVVSQFKGIEAVEPPDEFWQNITDTIEQQKNIKEFNTYHYLKQKLINIFRVKKPVIVIGGIIVTLLLILYLTTSPLNNDASNRDDINDYLEMNIRFLAEFDTYERIIFEDSNLEFDLLF